MDVVWSWNVSGIVLLKSLVICSKICILILILIHTSGRAQFGMSFPATFIKQYRDAKASLG